MPGESTSKVRIWDLPTRIFHWALALAAVALVVTAKIGEEAMLWHSRLGLAVGALLLFRLVWGWVGGHWSRFRSFPLSPTGAIRYLREGSAAAPVGHSPLAALSVYTLLLFLLAQVVSGLFSSDNADFVGPFGALVSNEAVKLLTRYHKYVGQYILFALVALHVIAIAYYYFSRRQDLVRPMWHGDKALGPRVEPSRDDWASRLFALAVLLVCAAIMMWISKVGS